MRQKKWVEEKRIFLSIIINYSLFVFLLNCIMINPLLSDRYLNCTYEDGTLNSGEEGINIQSCQPFSVKIDKLITRQGEYAIRSELRYDDPYGNIGPRAESTSVNRDYTRYQSGDIFFYGFSIYTEKNWINDQGYGDIVFQWHNIPDYDLVS